LGGGISRVLSRSRGEDHFSGSAVAGALERPTRDSDGAGNSSSPIWPCSGWGLPCHSCYQERGALLPHPFTLACALGSRLGPSAVCSLLHFPSPRGARALPGTLPCGARTFLDTRGCRDPHSPPNRPSATSYGRNCLPPSSDPAPPDSRPEGGQCPGEDSNLHAVSGTRSLVWPVYQFQHLGNRPSATPSPRARRRHPNPRGPHRPDDAPERTRTSTGLRPLDPESSASTSSATGAYPAKVRPERFELPAF
jgi:hypothetical protein